MPWSAGVRLVFRYMWMALFVPCGATISNVPSPSRSPTPTLEGVPGISNDPGCVTWSPGSATTRSVTATPQPSQCMESVATSTRRTPQTWVFEGHECTTALVERLRGTSP